MDSTTKHYCITMTTNNNYHSLTLSQNNNTHDQTYCRTRNNKGRFIESCVLLRVLFLLPPASTVYFCTTLLVLHCALCTSYFRSLFLRNFGTLFLNSLHFAKLSRKSTVSSKQKQSQLTETTKLSPDPHVTNSKPSSSRVR